MTVTHPFVAIPLAIAALITAWAVIWKRGVVPCYQFFARITYMLGRIEDEFAPNGGNSLRDQVDHKADKNDIGRLEAGMLEAIRIGSENQDTLTELNNRNHWHVDRPEVLARLRLVEQRQEQVRVSILAALAPVAKTEGAFGTLITQVLEALQDEPESIEQTD